MDGEKAIPPLTKGEKPNSVSTAAGVLLGVLTDAYLSLGDLSYMRQALQPKSSYPDLDYQTGLYGDPSSQKYKLFLEITEKAPDIFGKLEQRRSAVLSKPRKLIPAGDTELDIQVYELVEAVLTGIGGNDGGFSADLKSMLEAVQSGLCIMELDWQPVSEIRKNVTNTRTVKTDSVGVSEDILRGDFVIPVSLKHRYPAAFRFNRDGVIHIPAGDKGAFVPAPAMKYLTLVFGSIYENPYGTGLLQRIQWIFRFKKQCLTSWVVACDKCGSPLAVVKQGPNATDEECDRIDEILEKIATDTGIRIPESMSIEFKDANSSNVGQAFNLLMQYLDSCISQCIVGSTLTSSEGQHGTQALGAVHAAVAAEKIVEDAQLLMWAVNMSLIRGIVDVNFGVNVPAPIWYIDTDPDSRESDAKINKMLTDMGLPVPIKFAYKSAMIDTPEEDEVCVMSGKLVKFRSDISEMPQDSFPQPGAPVPPSDQSFAEDFKQYMGY